MALDVNDDQQLLTPRKSGEDEALLILGVIGVGRGDRQWVPEGSSRFGKGDAVEPHIRGCLLGIPCKSQSHAWNLRAPTNSGNRLTYTVVLQGQPSNNPTTWEPWQHQRGVRRLARLRSSIDRPLE